MTLWRDVPIGDVLTLQRGFDITRESQSEGSVPVISSGGVSSYHDTSMADGPGVVIGRKGTLGKAFYSEGPYWPHDTTLWVRDFKGSEPKFVYYFFKNLDISFLDVGSANPTLNRNHVHPIVTRWPDAGSQRAIAQVLGALDDKIAANSVLLQSVDDLCAAWFSALSAGHPVGALSDVADINRTTVRPGATHQLRYLDISSVGVGAYDWPELSDWEDAPGRARRSVAFGDTVWSTVRPGRRSHALVLDDDEKLIGSTGLAVLSPGAAGPAFVYEASRTEEFTAYLESVAEGSAYPAVRADRFAGAPVPDVPASDRDAFEDGAMTARMRAHNASIESRKLAELRDTLLPNLMSGRISVRHAESVVSEAL